jgi:alkylhydroperoxidase family enzyme
VSRISNAEVPDDLPIVNNLVRAAYNNPDMYRGFASLSGRVHSTSHLSARLRELVVLRTVARLGATYEWANHVPGARSVGVTDDEIRALRDGSLSGFDPAEAAAIRYAEAVEDRAVDRELWAATQAHYSPVELLDLAMLVGFYGLASRVVLALEVPLDEGTCGFEAP